MFSNPLNNDSDNQNTAEFDLELNQLDRYGNILFILGVILALQSLDIADQFIILGQTQQLSSQEESAFIYDISKLLALANWIYLSAGLIFVNTSYARLQELLSSLSTNISSSGEERIEGRKLILAGNIFKSIGYALSATGNEMIADSARVDRNS